MHCIYNLHSCVLVLIYSSCGPKHGQCFKSWQAPEFRGRRRACRRRIITAMRRQVFCLVPGQVELDGHGDKYDWVGCIWLYDWDRLHRVFPVHMGIQRFMELKKWFLSGSNPSLYAIFSFCDHWTRIIYRPTSSEQKAPCVSMLTSPLQEMFHHLKAMASHTKRHMRTCVHTVRQHRFRYCVYVTYIYIYVHTSRGSVGKHCKK